MLDFFLLILYLSLDKPYCHSVNQWYVFSIYEGLCLPKIRSKESQSFINEVLISSMAFIFCNMACNL